MKYSLTILLGISLSVIASAQSTSKFADITGTIGSSQGSISGSYVHNWKLFRKKKWEAGLGARWTSYIGTKVEFITAAPAKHTRSFTAPFLIVFAGQREENFDTLTVQRPFTNSVNISVNLGYNFNKKWYGGFNIDLVGFTFGRKGSGILQSNGTTTNDPGARPPAFNLLLTGDHDYGTLNSEFFVKYAINDRWKVRAVYQFLFVEYTTENVKQQIPEGPLNDRFRNKANNFGAGLSYHFK
ncbi:MAG TPA: outer membrane beta-barrel protein [Chitinophagaceae bacterium]